MKYKRFLKIGLAATVLSFSLNSSYAKDTNDTHLVSSIKNETSSFSTAIKTTSFVLLGSLAVGTLGMGYFFIRLADAGKPIFNKQKRQDETDFVQACRDNDLNKVKLFLTKKSVDIHIQNDLAIKIACKSGYLNLVKYLLTSPDLKKHSKIHADEDDALKLAYKHNKISVVEYLIFEYKIKKTKSIEEFMGDKPPLQQLFDKRSLNNLLNKDLDHKQSTNQRNKI